MESPRLCTAELNPLVNVARKFNCVFPTQTLGEDTFVTRYSFKRQMENQALLFNEIFHNTAYWKFVPDKGRIVFTPQKHEVEDFIRFGIPPECREKMWLALAGVTVTPELTTKYPVLAAKQNEFSELIARDVGRTFEINDPTFQEKLSRVLTAYANHNPDIGYCQSMNILAATLLIFMPEEPAFAMLGYLVEELLPKFHIEAMPGYLAAVEKFQFLLLMELPEIHAHFEKINFKISTITTPWFLSLFVHTLPNVTAFVVWDNILLNGPSTIFEVALAVLRFLEKEILQIQDCGDMLLHIPKRMKEIYDPDQLIAHWDLLGTEKIKFAQEAIKRMKEEVPRAEAAIRNFPSATYGSPFTTEELKELWEKCVIKFPVLCHKGPGLDAHQFSQFVSQSFSEWYLDRDLQEQLFQMMDLNKDGGIDFPELVCFLYVICRSSFVEFAEFTMTLYDVEGKGWLDKAALTRMLRSIYGMYQKDKSFKRITEGFTSEIFKFAAISFCGVITADTFRDVVLVQSQMLEKLKKRNPTTIFNIKNSFLYWMEQFLTSRERPEIVQIIVESSNLNYSSSESDLEEFLSSSLTIAVVE